MPGIFYQPVNRRRFLVATTKALAAITVIRETDLFGEDVSAKEKPVHLALLSDIHIPADQKNEYRGFLPWQNLKNIVPQVIETRPDNVIINGDVARLTGEAADYQAVKQLLAPVAE